MVSGVVLEIGVQQFVAGPYHQRGSELRRASAGLVLDIPARDRPSTGDPLARTEQRGSVERLRPDDVGRRSVLVQQDLERDPLILDEGLGVAFPTGAYRDDVCARRPDVFVPISDLTGPLTTGQSTEMSEEENERAVFGPAITEPVLVPVRIDECVVRKSRDVETHERPGITSRANNCSPVLS